MQYAFFGIAAGIVSFAAFIPYVRGILKGTTVPNRATWIIWGAIGIVSCGAFDSMEPGFAFWASLVYAICPTLIALLILLPGKGKGGWEKLDIGCFAGAIMLGILWFVFKYEPIMILLAAIGIDMLGILPTIKKSWIEPHKEEMLAWMLSALGGVLNLYATEQSDLSVIAYPLYLAIGSSVVYSILIWRTKIQKIPRLD
jgi:hypothetical protein